MIKMSMCQDDGLRPAILAKKLS